MKKINYVGKKVMLENPTSTTSRKMYKIIGLRDELFERLRFEIINDNGRRVYLLTSRFNTNSWSN